MSSVRHYFVIAGALLALLAVTVAVAYLNLGAFNTPAAMGIAAVKAALILLYFMHLRRAAGLQRLFAVAGFFWLGIMLVLAMSDYLTR